MNIIENEFVKFWLEDGILFSAFKECAHMGIEDAKQIIELRHKISNNDNQYWVMDLRNLKSVSNETHSYIDKNGQDYVHATAVIVNTFLVKFLVEVFIQVRKPKVPMRIFRSEENAVTWLKEMRNNQNSIAVNV